MAVAMAAATGNTKQRRGPRPRCVDCFFHQNMLCALGLEDGCPTFRPAHPDGLKPPQQLSFVFRQERRTQAIAFQPQYP
jgi:hypothetical protein